MLKIGVNENLPEPTELKEAADETEITKTAEPEPSEEFALGTSVSFLLSEHTVQSLTNLICMIYSRETLLSKAPGGKFFARKWLADAILYGKNLRSVPELISYIKEYDRIENSLKGITFTDDRIIFDGFGSAQDNGNIQAFMKLAATMNKMAMTQKRVQAKQQRKVCTPHLADPTLVERYRVQNRAQAPNSTAFWTYGVPQR